MKHLLSILLLYLSLSSLNTHATTITYLVDVNQIPSYVQLDIVTFADISGQLEVNISGNDIWFTNVSLSTDSNPDEGYRLLETAIGSYDGVDFTYQSPSQPYSSYFGSFDGTSLSLYTDYIFYSEIYGDVASVSSVPLPAAVWLFGSGLLGLIGLGKRKALIHQTNH